MKFFCLFAFLLLFGGCVYFNNSGISTHLYNDCKEYYDNCGNYHKECPENLVDYSNIGSILNNTDKETRQRECSESK